MKKPDSIVIGIIIVTLVIAGGIFAAMKTSQGSPIPQYKIGDSNSPKLQIGQVNFDFGKMKLTDIKSQEIPVKNIGAKPLILSDFITSCDCTFAQITIRNQESPIFSMHRNPAWRGQLEPDETAIVKVTYEPSVMPVEGFVQRAIVFKTNDPQSPLINIKLTAYVE